MEQIYERTQKLKNKILDRLELRINAKTTTEELLVIAKILNEVEEDRSFYSRAIGKLYENNTALGFNGSTEVQNKE